MGMCPEDSVDYFSFEIDETMVNVGLHIIKEELHSSVTF